MFVKVYRYNIPKEKRTEWEDMVRRADVLYKEAGEKDYHLLIREEDESLYVTELAYHESKTEYKKIEERIKNNETLQALRKQFNRFQAKDFVEEEYERII